MTDDLFTQAQAYERLGYVCVPINISVDAAGSKIIDTPEWRGSRRFTMRHEWDGYTGIAFNTGASGIVAVDIDTGNSKDGFAGLVDAGIELPDTPITATSRSGGEHRIYRQGPIRVKNSSSLLAKDVDVRAEGGLLAVSPTKVINRPDQAYRWNEGVQAVPVAQLPEFPEELARKLTVQRQQKRTIAAPEGVTPADVTPEQSDWARQKIGFKIGDIAAAGPGERNQVLGSAVPRIIGLAKTIGEDLNTLSEKIVAAYQESGGDDEEQVIDWIGSAIEYASPEDSQRWLPTDRARSFWDSRPELRQIRQAAFAGMASPWAVLGALCVRVLGDVPPTHRIITGVGDPAGGNLNLYAVLAAESGGGKGVATQVARHLWPSDQAYYTETSSGEALPRLFVRRVKEPATGEYFNEKIRDSVIIDAPEFGSLSASGSRQGATLSQRLCNGFSGEGLSFAVSDESKNVDVPSNSYRLGVITGVQYGNAGMLLAESSTVTGLPQRFVWFPANVKPEELPEVRPSMPEPLGQRTFPPGGSRITVCDEAREEIEAAQRAKLIGDTASPLDGHKSYARVKLAYALAVLNGHYSSVRVEDWELSGIVMDVSDATRQKAVDTLRARDRKKAKAAGERDGIRKASAVEAEADELHARIVTNIVRHLTEAGGRLRLSGRDGLKQKMRRQRESLDDVLADLSSVGRVVLEGDDWVRLM